MTTLRDHEGTYIVGRCVQINQRATRLGLYRTSSGPASFRYIIRDQRTVGRANEALGSRTAKKERSERSAHDRDGMELIAASTRASRNDRNAEL